MKIFETIVNKSFITRVIHSTLFIIISLFINKVQAQISCSLGDPVFVENFGSGSDRLGPSLNQDPNTNVHPNFRPAGLYTYVGTGSVSQDQYGIMKDPKDAAPGGAGWNDSFSDHTGNLNGYLYYCDAKEDLNVFYAQKIDGLCENIEYELSAWFAKTNAPNYFIDPNIKLIIGFTDINDQNIGSITETNTGSIEGVGANRWHRGSLVFTVPSGTENIYFMLKNNVAGTAGNDLAIDDIEIRPCGPDINILNQITNAVINANDITCITDASNSSIEIIANTPNGFAHQWQESIGNDVWTDISGEILNTLNYSIPINSNPEHLIRLKFAHSNNNLNNNKCFFLSQETKYSKVLSFPTSDITECDNITDSNDFNGVIQTFDLESKTNTILGGQPTPQYSVTYHLSQLDADTGVNSLSSPHENNLSPNSQTIFTRVLNNNTGCFNSNTTFDLIVSPLPESNSVLDIEICDNLDDGNNQNGIVQTFDLESQTNTILGTQVLSNYTVTYHLSQSDANAGINSLSSPHENSLSPNSQIIHARVINNTTGCVNTHLVFNLIVNTIPIATTVSDLELCDNIIDGNDTNGIVQSFNLESHTNTILGTQLATNFTVTYHLSQAEAVSGINPLSSPHENNLSPNSEVIYVRLQNNITGCVNSDSTFNLIVHSLPIVSNSVSLVQCDDDDIGTLGFSPFNLTEANAEISTNAINETFTYFSTQNAAILGDTSSPDHITNPTTYINQIISSDKAWVRTTNILGCSRVSEIQLNVSTTIIPSSFQRVFSTCDDFLDIDGNDNLNNNNKDGISYFDFSSVTAEILALIPSGQNPLPPRYYRNKSDALAEINEILNPSNYRNIGYPATQQIYIRVDSDIVNDCLGLGAHITLNTEALPIANPVPIQIECDNDINTNDGLFPFDTSAIENTILGGQILANVTVNYNYLDIDGITMISSSNLPNPFLSVSQVMTVRVSNNNTLDPNGACYDETSIEFIVNKQPIANPVNDQIFCDGDAGDIADDEIYPFNTSAFESTIKNTQTDIEIYYNYIDENGNLIIDSTSLPNPLNSGSQTIIANVINPINYTCIATTSINLIVNPLPEFTIETPQIVCSSDPTFTIVLDPIEANITENFNYEWIYQDGTFLSNANTLTVSTPGTYSVTLTNPITNCTRTRDVFVNASELATITLDDVTIVDVSETNSVTINPANLGLGDYEYALKEADEFFIVYQDEPFFDNVKAGFYTIFVRDKKGCGTTPIDISVIGYPKFFTPNNDGNNDFWQIKGVNAQFQPNSSIHIFDRYGKLIKQINPASNGWDGTFNGGFLNTDDYWFKVLLQDGRQFMGHFTLKR